MAIMQEKVQDQVKGKRVYPTVSELLDNMTQQFTNKEEKVTDEQKLDKVSEMADKLMMGRSVCFFLAGLLLPTIYGAKGEKSKRDKEGKWVGTWIEVASLRLAKGYNFLSTKTDIYRALKLARKAPSVEYVEKNLHNNDAIDEFNKDTSKGAPSKEALEKAKGTKAVSSLKSALKYIVEHNVGFSLADGREIVGHFASFQKKVDEMEAIAHKAERDLPKSTI